MSRILKNLFVFMALVGCTPALSAAPVVKPAAKTAIARPAMATAIVAGDTILVRATCDTDAPSVACFITVRDSIAGTTVLNNVRVTLGQTVSLPPRLCTVPGPVVYTASFVGVTASGRTSATTNARGEVTCDPAAAPARATLIVEIRPGG